MGWWVFVLVLTLYFTHSRMKINTLSSTDLKLGIIVLCSLYVGQSSLHCIFIFIQKLFIVAVPGLLGQTVEQDVSSVVALKTLLRISKQFIQSSSLTHFNGVVVDELVSSCYDNLWGEGVLHGDPQPLLDMFTDRHTPMVALIHLLQQGFEGVADLEAFVLDLPPCQL